MQPRPTSSLVLRFVGLIVAASAIHNVGAAVYTSDSEVDMAGFLRGLDVCLLEPGFPGSPVNVSLGMLGELQVARLCCSGTEVANLSASFATPGRGPGWQGDVDLSFALGGLTTHCHGDWAMVSGIRSGKRGAVAFDISKDNKSTVPLQLNFSVDGKNFATKAREYPFPLSISGEARCTDDPLITGIDFTGDDAWVLTKLGSVFLTSAFQSWLIKPLIRKFCANDVPRVVNDALGQLRDKAAPLLQEVAEDLPAPVAPDGSGRRVDLRQGAVGWFGGLLQQGFATGQAAELLDKIAQGIPSEVRELPGGGVQLASMATEHPAELALDVFLQGASLAGLRTLSAAGVEALGPELLSLSMRQAALNVSAEIGFTATAGLASAGAADVSARRLLGVRGEWLFEGRRPLEELRDRFQLHLSLENLSAGARVGLLLDDARVQELTRGQSWYDTKCMRGMVQNASVTGVDVLVTVPRFVWNSKSRSVGALETDLDAAINSVLGYLNVPQMRPTVSRMVQSVAAGKVRDVVNAQLQGILADSDDSECDPKYGFQQMQLFYVLAFAGGVSVLAACAAWLLGKAFVPAGGAGQGTRASSQGAVILLAMASACLQQCGLLALPLRAAMRFRSGDPRDDIFGNVFLMGLADPIGRVDGFLAVALVAVGVGATRALCVALAAASGFSPKASRLALRLAGFGGWGFALTAILATTQVVAFHISILTFGDSSLVLGAMLGGCVYLQLLGLYLCDAASVAVLRQCGADRPLAEDGPAAVVRGEGGLAGQPGSQTAGALAASVAPPLGLMASGLAGVLAVLPFLPWIPLWAQEWGGLVGEVATYQSQEAHRVVSLADVLANQGFLVNPGPLQVGARVMQLFVLLHTLVAPAAHASLAVAVGMQLRGRASAEASSELLSVHLVGGLELMRMWSAADVFAIAVMVSVADLGNELAMMRQQMCSAVEPVLPATGMTCFEVDCVARPGLAALLVWGLASRLLAELSAHRPLRRLRLRGGDVGAAAGGPAACDAAASAEVELGRSFG